MTSSHIDPIARRFIIDSIKSVAQLDLLLLLRTNPQQGWTAEELARELRMDPGWTRMQLAAMAKSGILGSPRDDCFIFKPASAQVEQAITATAQAYLLHRVSVIELIYNPEHQSLRDFADAFRLRKEEPDG
jgi:hypothetical protein